MAKHFPIPFLRIEMLQHKCLKRKILKDHRKEKKKDSTYCD